MCKCVAAATVMLHCVLLLECGDGPCAMLLLLCCCAPAVLHAQLGLTAGMCLGSNDTHHAALLADRRMGVSIHVRYEALLTSHCCCCCCRCDLSAAGSWSIGGFGTCISCPAGSTSDPMAASPYDCQTCLPGWGSSADQNSTGSPQNSNFEMCTPCDYGFYSAGGAGPCVACDDG
jgi:hypothetical protein